MSREWDLITAQARWYMLSQCVHQYTYTKHKDFFIDLQLVSPADRVPAVLLECERLPEIEALYRLGRYTAAYVMSTVQMSVAAAMRVLSYVDGPTPLEDLEVRATAYGWIALKMLWGVRDEEKPDWVAAAFWALEVEETKAIRGETNAAR